MAAITDDGITDFDAGVSSRGNHIAREIHSLNSRRTSNGMTNFSLPNTQQHASLSTNPEEGQRNELCMRLAENLHDLGACEFTLELRAGGERFIVRVSRAETPCTH